VPQISIKNRFVRITLLINDSHKTKSVNGIRIFEVFRKTPICDNALTYVTARDAAVAAAADRKETSARVPRRF